MRCPACSSPALDVFFEGGSVPVHVNVLHADADSAIRAPRGRMRLAACASCGLVHNVAFEPELVEYAPGYENSLHGSPTFQRWACEVAERLAREHALEGRTAVEVGGGRGEFMALLLEAGARRGLVVDPSAEPASALDPGSRGAAGLAIESRRFRPGDVDGDVRLVLSRHVLEHVPQPLDFASTLASAAAAAGAGLYLEVPNGRWVLDDGGTFDVIYEHCSYFTAPSLHRLALAAGASAPRTREAFHGQFLSAESLGTAARSGAGREAAEDPSELDLAGALEGFEGARRRTVARWDERISEARRDGAVLAVWGAGSKCATFLDALETRASIDCAVDVNPKKQGRFVSGTGHLVVGPGEIRARGVDTLIVLNPAYAAEISRMAKAAGSDAELWVDHGPPARRR